MQCILQKTLSWHSDWRHLHIIWLFGKMESTSSLLKYILMLFYNDVTGRRRRMKVIRKHSFNYSRVPADLFLRSSWTNLTSTLTSLFFFNIMQLKLQPTSSTVNKKWSYRPLQKNCQYELCVALELPLGFRGAIYRQTMSFRHRGKGGQRTEVIRTRRGDWKTFEKTSLQKKVF